MTRLLLQGLELDIPGLHTGIC